jgi:pimeloyl-ACP methyl ester carboxylesterase
MSTLKTVDRQAQFIRLILALLGAALAIVGWARFAGGHPRPAPDAATWQDPSRHRVQFVTVEDGVTLEVLDWGGAGTPVVLLAGSGNTAHVFDGFAEKLAGAAHVYGITRRGYGLSSHPASGYGEPRLADDILRVLDSLKIAAPVLVGHSMAGEELTRLGNDHSDRLAGLVYMDAAADPTDFPASSRAYMELLRNLPAGMMKPPSPTASDRKSFQAYHEFWVRTGEMPFPESELRNQHDENPDGSVGRFRSTQQIHNAIGAGALTRDYSNIRVPILAMFPSAGQKPEYEPKTDQERAAIAAHDAALAAYINRWKRSLRTAPGGVRIVDVPGAKHYLFFTRESDVLRELRAFMARLPQRSE